MINPTGESNIYNMDNGSNTSPTQKNGTESNLKRTHSNVSSSTNQNPESPSRCASRNRPASNKPERNNLSRTSSQVSFQPFCVGDFANIFCTPFAKDFDMNKLLKFLWRGRKQGIDVGVLLYL